MKKNISKTIRYVRQGIFILATLISIAGCSESGLSDKSVIGIEGTTEQVTELDQWILETFTSPYNIEIIYRWNRNEAQDGSYTYPPDLTKVKSILETIKALWIDVYTLPELGDADFFIEKNPIKIYLYGGKNLDANGVEHLCNTENTTREMFLYNVNEFNKSNKEQVYLLMRSVHHQYTRLLMETLPYNRNAFLKVSRNRYLESTKLIAEIFKGRPQGIDLFEPSPYANKRGFFTFHSFLSLESDFAEIASIKLTHSQKDIMDFLEEAKEPYQDPANPDIQAQYDEDARQAYKELTEKLEFVENYFKKTVKLSLNHLQIVSIKQFNKFLKEQQ